MTNKKPVTECDKYAYLECRCMGVFCDNPVPEKKERYRVLVMSFDTWLDAVGIKNEIVAHAVRNKTICHTYLQMNYFKKIN